MHLVNAHPQHGNYVAFVPYTQKNPETTKRNGKDAFYGNYKAQEKRDSIDEFHQARLVSKSGEGFIADLRLAQQDIVKRVRCRY